MTPSLSLGRLRLPPLLIALVCGGAVSCSMGPDYRRPDLTVPGTFRRTTEGESAQPALASNWWTLFNDPALTKLAEGAAAANLDIQSNVRSVRFQNLRNRLPNHCARHCVNRWFANRNPQTGLRHYPYPLALQKFNLPRSVPANPRNNPSPMSLIGIVARILNDRSTRPPFELLHRRHWHSEIMHTVGQ